MSFEEWWMKHPNLQFRNEYYAALEAWEAGKKDAEKKIERVENILKKKIEELLEFIHERDMDESLNEWENCN